MYYKVINFSIGLLLISFSAYSKFPDHTEFGNVSLNEMEMSVYQADSNASVLYFFELGRSWRRIGESRNLFQYHGRLKVLQNSGIEVANVKILVDSKGISSNFLEFKAATYNLIDGKVETSALDNKNIHFELIADLGRDGAIYNMTFALPKVKVGSVIEIAYTQILKPGEIRSWDFQREHPVLWSEYELSFPWDTKYFSVYQGLHTLLAKEENLKIAYRKLINAPRAYSKDFDRKFTLHLDSRYSHWAAEDIPALKADAFIGSEEDYLSRINIYVNSTSVGYLVWNRSYNTRYKAPIRNKVFKDYEELRTDLILYDNFGKSLAESDLFKDASNIDALAADREESRLKTAFDFIKEKVKWNGEYNIFAERSLHETWKAKTGNSAELNFLLIRLLKELGFESSAVFVAFRNSGRAKPQPISLGMYRTIVTGVKLGEDNYIFLDPCQDYLPFD